MSRGHSQPQHHRGRRVLERCQAKGSIEVIDVDKGEIDVVIIDEPETSRQGSKGSKETINNCYPDGVISIDDEEGGSEDAPQHLHGSAKNKVFQSSSSDSSTSEESKSAECLMSTKNDSIPFKKKFCRTSINRFGLGSESSDSETSSSESNYSVLNSSQISDSDSSDCEIMEDSSGNIRVEWEKAALRKKMSEKGRFGLEDQASVSTSSGDQILSEEGIQSKLNVEDCSKDPVESCSIGKCNAKESLSFDIPLAAEVSNPHLKTNAKSSIGVPGSSMDIHHEEAGSHKNEHSSETYIGKTHLERHCAINVKDAETSTSTADEVSGMHLESKRNTCVAQRSPCTDIPQVAPGFQRKEHISGACCYKAQSSNNSLPDDKRADFQDPEILLGNRVCNMDINEGVGFLHKDTNIPTGTSPCNNGLHGGSGFQEEVAPCYGKTVSCSRQPCSAKKGSESADNVGLQKQKEQVFGEPSSITRSHCNSVVGPQIASFLNKEKPIYNETSMFNHQLFGKSVLTVNAEATHRKSSCNSHAGSVIAEQSYTPPSHGDFICKRERHKESDEYKQADEEEWAARQKQLQIQAEEAQRLKRKRKAESLRLLDMARRQKERLEEIRESQKKGEETENLKERFRAEVRKELDKVEQRYRDMASLLRGLGIPVAGGPYPLTREVNAAYKQALLKFHPDRASSTNIRQQVEAEEKFKLITRLKEKLQF